MYNPNVKLGVLAVNPTWATLKTVDDKLSFDFILNPESVQWTHSATVNELSVLRSKQPLVNYQASKSVLTLPNIKLWTVNNSGSLKEPIDTLRQMTKPLASTGVLPVLALTWGSLSQPRLHLVSVDITETQWRSGVATKAIANMTFVIAPEIPKAVYQELPQDKPPTAAENKGAVSTIKATNKAKLSPTEQANRRKAEATVKASLTRTDAASKQLIIDSYKALGIKTPPKPNKVDPKGKVVTGTKAVSEYDTAKAYWDKYFKGKK